MNRKLLYLTTIILTLVGCASEDYVGNEELHEANENGRPVSFDLTSAPQTRSERYGAEAASDLNNNFVVWGDKTMSDNTTQKVFDNYQVNYVANSAHTSTTNSAGWEYIGCENLPNGVTSNIGVTAFSESESNTGVYQSIKYWDFSATQYNFFAYSLGKGVEVTSATNPKTYKYATSSNMTSTGYNLSGSVDELAACYISDKVMRPKAEMSATNTQVSLKFRRLGAKVRIALYETIPGYSVKDVKFYQSATDNNPGTEAYLYAADGITKFCLGDLDNDGQGNIKYATIRFDENGSPVFGWPTGNSTDQTYISFGDSDPTTTDWGNWAGRENKMQAEGKYIGRSSTSATGPKDFMSVLPTSSNATPTDLKLKVDYTLLSQDDSEEEIHVTGATVTVPAQFAVWKPNCAYTYLFKITDSDLRPITLDAVYVNAEGQQETITTVTEPSITTYQQGADHVVAGGEYVADKPIYIVAYDGTEVATLSYTNATLFIASLAGASGSPATSITESTVADLLVKKTADGDGKYVGDADANGWIMTVAPSTETLSLINVIPAGATPDNNAITFGVNKVATFTPAVESGVKYYVFRYQRAAVAETANTPARDAVDQYKVIKVAAAP